jgi:hypothetical protein
MSTSAFNFKYEPLAVRVTFDEHGFTAHLSDGRSISLPYAYSARLAKATPEQRADYELIADGYGIHWPQIDEDLSVAGMLRQA